MKFIIPIIAVVILLQGCGNLLSSSSIPDETRVVDGPSLTIPPDFELKAPSKLAERDTSYNAAEKAKGVLLGAKSVKPVSSNDSWLLKKAGTADSDIREQLEAEENAKKAVKKSSWFSNMWGGSEEESE